MAYEGDFESLWVHLGVNLGPLWAYRRRMAGTTCAVAGLMVSLSAPSGPISRKYTFSPRILLFKEATGVPGKVRFPPFGFDTAEISSNSNEIMIL